MEAETKTFKRNGVYIILPATKQEVDKNNSKSIMKPYQEQILIVKMARPIQAKFTKKGCIRCGCDCWRSDVNYCWDCYKYEKFESR